MGGVLMGEPKRTWAEDSRPTAEQLARWLLHGLEVPQDWQLAALGQLLNAAERGESCWNNDHERQGMALACVVQDVNEMEARLRDLIRDMTGRQGMAAVRRRLRQIIGDPEERGFQRPTVPSDLVQSVSGAALDGVLRLAAGAAPHQVAHMSNGRCSMGSVSHAPHDGCPGISNGQTAPTTMIGKSDG
jgi:hypothetical protein